MESVIFYPLVATMISAAFAVTLWRQYRRKPRAYLLAWSIALAIYAVAALAEVIGAAGGWNPLLYRVYYYFGGITVVGVLALGTIYLLAPRFGRAALLILVVLAGIGLAGIIGATLQPGLLDTHQVPSVDTIKPGVPRLRALLRRAGDRRPGDVRRIPVRPAGPTPGGQAQSGDLSLRNPPPRPSPARGEGENGQRTTISSPLNSAQP